MSDIPAVGIDLGTSNSVIALVHGNKARVIADRHGRRIHPSVVNFHPDGSVIVGAEAKKRRVIDPTNTITSAKRLIGQNFRSEQVREALQRSPYRILEGEHQQVMISARGNDYTVPEISALVLRYVKTLAEQEIGQPIAHAVITVPANFNDSQREATRIAGEIAGLHVLRVLNEPTAAALAYGYGQGMSNRIVIYDFGGGTFDVTILQLDDQVFEVMSTAGDSFLGGDDVDELIVMHMVQLFLQQHRVDLRPDIHAMVRLRAVAEQIKCNLSTKPRAVVQVKEIAHGMGGAALDLHFELTQEQLAQLADKVVKRSFLICDEALNLAKVATTQIDDVVMVGGTTRMPVVRQAVQGYFGLLPRVDINPDEVVAVGAAIQAAALLRSAVATPRRSQPPAPPPRPTQKTSRGLPSVGGPPPLPGGPPPAPGAVPASGAVPLPPIPPGGAGAIDPHVQTIPEVQAVLLDVTPRALGIAVVGGFSEVIVPRNAQIPLEQTRRFSTGQDNQRTVRIQVCQGESRVFAENEALGELLLDDLRPAPRGQVEIEVAFEVDANGILQVSAVDMQTGRMQKARVQLLGTVDASKIAELKARHDQLPEVSGF